MGRKLKKVPLDFDWPLDTIWRGYEPKNAEGSIPFVSCKVCEAASNECEESAAYCIYYPANYEKWYEEPPKGEGYQLWETTTEGSPISPIFKTLRELAEWAAENATTFASNKATADEWEKMLDEDNVHHQEGNFVFI